jgi:signal transduction histidine kinase
MPIKKPDLSATQAEQVLVAIEEGLVVFDRGDRVLYRNRAFAELWQDDPEMTGAETLQAMVDRVRTAMLNREGLESLDTHLSDPMQPRSLELHLDGERFLELAMQPLTRRGRMRGRIWRFRDRTPQKRSELAMLHAQKLESLGVLAGGIAHDFNNLLSSILGHSELGLAEIAADTPAAESFRAIGKAAERASELTQQMLAYAGKGTVLVEPIDLSDLVEEVANLMRVSIPDGVELALVLEGELPPIIADATQIRQVAMNLLLNAAEAVEENGRIHVETGVHRIGPERIAAAHHAEETVPGEFVFLEVRDDGRGMNAETLSRVFDPFFSTKFTGRGLGLAAVLGIVRGHRGLLEVRSRSREGSTFRVHLPRGYDSNERS